MTVCVWGECSCSYSWYGLAAHFYIPGLNRSATFSAYELKKKKFKRDGQSCVMLPYLDCHDCENWECKILKRGATSQKRLPKGRSGLVENIRGKEGGRRDSKEERNYRK